MPALARRRRLPAHNLVQSDRIALDSDPVADLNHALTPVAMAFEMHDEVEGAHDLCADGPQWQPEIAYYTMFSIRVSASRAELAWIVVMLPS